MTNVLIAEGFSCQREIILLLKKADFLKRLKVFTCHSQDRPEIFSVADDSFEVNYAKIGNPKEYIQTIIEYCLDKKITTVFAGKYTEHYENMRHEFDRSGITLFAGAIGAENQKTLKDKMAFTRECERLGLPVTPAAQFQTVDELKTLIAKLKPIYGQLSVKPVDGVYGYGFLELNDDITLYEQLNKKYVCRTQQFIDAYSELTNKPKYLLMPFLSGKECSVDIACNEGEILAKATRIKEGDYQSVYLDFELDPICEKLVKHFNCHGLINIQFRMNDKGDWFILEINSRPAGGFAYSELTGLNLIGHVFKKICKELVLFTPKISHIKVKSISSVVHVKYKDEV